MNRLYGKFYSYIFAPSSAFRFKASICIPRLIPYETKKPGHHKIVSFDKFKIQNIEVLLRDFQIYLKFWNFKFNRFDCLKIMNITPPDCVKGMTELDRSKFKKEVFVPGLKIPVKHIVGIRKVFKKSLLKLPRVKHIVELSQNDPDFKSHKLMLLDIEKYKSKDDFAEIDAQVFINYDIDKVFKLYKIELEYENWSMEDIVRGIIPEGETIVSGFDIVGHIAHLNLKDHLIDYKTIIGQIILDKFPNLKTVVNKTNTIDNTYRNFQMELLAGIDKMEASLKENGCTFDLDFSKVYWNSRLGTEHQRIVDKVEKKDVVFDVFAGIGPFAVPLGVKGISVYANDLNPESHRWLQHNANRNRVTNMVKCYNMDGRDFIKQILTSNVKECVEKLDTETLTVHVVMNLPGIAIEFLDAFQGLFEENPDVVDKVSIAVHCYCFSKAENQIQEIKDRVKQSLGVEPPEKCIIRHVRKVAPNKDMFCVEFNVQKNILVKHLDASEPEHKRLKIE